MNKKLILLFILCSHLLLPIAQSVPKSYYWVQLKDKKGTIFQTNQPEEFLSKRSIDRRKKQHLLIDESDLPVSVIYLDTLRKRGLEIFHTSKWLNGVTVRTDDTALIRKIKTLPFVTSVQFTRPANTLKSGKDKFSEEKYTTDNDPASYGTALTQLTQLNGQFLHNKGYKGKGIQVAIIDNGFWHVNEIAAFDSLRLNHRILGTRDFVDPKSDFYQQATHGMSVLSCMAGNIPNKIIGTAPDAAYYLLRTEDSSSEYLVEEDNWLSAAEYADSLGVDLINSSLGYNIFDDALMNHTYSNMDGKTTRVTQAANMAFRKGILVVTSAGNEGNNVWKKIIAPSDGEGVLGIAAVDKDRIRAGFSSIGPAWGGAIKPNVAAIGLSTYLVNSSGSLGYSNGTSFSSPVMAGIAACLMQANPNANVSLIKSAIEQSGHQFSKPDSLLGFGIPDFEKADQYLKANIIKELVPNKFVKVGPNPFIDQILIHNYSEKINDQLLITISDHRGIRLFQSTFRNDQMIELNHLGGLPEGLLIMTISNGELTERVKLIKISK